ncbi:MULTISPECIES: hybrid sensor histidine kinase/response regulator [unclassified Shinella]|uniref:hybrid sensor histidine kinase/response regulator n=1 Tax=unclassified Shinella TaxID=2643062 RepID=UPI00234F9CB4|nr:MULTISPECIES: response regulator [unclassified Shinella]MCO5151365.1 response regulator [Shinella sp.]MDC7266246.1 response regulator [Shinella sp. HY16]MDC7273143.1 response regulator [Shinella sp. YZ44]
MSRSPASFLSLRRLSIRVRLVLLAAVLLFATIGSSLFTRSELSEALESGEEANRIAEIIVLSDDVRAAFNSLRYWQADLSVSLLTLAETRAGEARTRLGERLDRLAEHRPAEAEAIRQEVARFDDLATQAVDAYTDDQRVIGNTHFAEARRYGISVDEQLTALQGVLSRQATAARANILRQFERAANVASLLSIAAVVIGAVLTIVILGSILKPLGEIVAAVRGLTAGDADVAVPAAAADELGKVSAALQLLKEGQAERARLTQEAEHQRRTLVDAIESIAEGFTLYGPDERLLIVNQRFRDMHPVHDAMVAGTSTFRDVIEAGGRHVVELDKPFDEWFATRLASHDHSATRVTPFRDGRWMQISERRTHEGGFTIVYVDITELRQRQQELELARDEAQRATQVKSEFLANMSHELRTPLNAIIGYAQILQEDAEDTGQTDFLPDLKKIESAGNHLLGLINGILDLSKIEAGRMEVYRERFDIGALTQDVAALIRPLAAKNDNTFAVECPADIGTIETDITKVKQTLLNLLSNACKFTEKGTVTLTVARQGKGAGRLLSLTVRDTGIGMNEEQLGRLFQAFSQADSSTSRKFGGTGLGLAISRSFAQMLGGDLTVESRPGEGSRFTFILPDPQENTADDAEDGEGLLGEEAGLAARPEQAERPAVLVVDDDEASMNIIGSHLKRDGYRVLYAGTGEQALDMARKHRPAAITLDILMPQMDGWSVLVALKSDPELAAIPVVIVSISNEKALGFTLGAAAMLAKPVDRGELSDFIARLTGGSQGGTVLVVEDDPATRLLMQRTVERLGRSVALTENGRQGMAWLAANPPPVAILLDLQMPEMNGFEFLAALREREEWDTVPVLVVTAKHLSNAERDLLSARATQIIGKGKGAHVELTQALREVIVTRTRKTDRELTP